MGLLASEKKGSHYKFNEDDSKDIEKIIQLKYLGFSLLEIQKILSYQRLSGRATDSYRSMYLSLLESKKEEIILAQQKYEEMNNYLKETINELKTDTKDKTGILGFPISSISLLQCPKCGYSLNILDGLIEKNILAKGSIKCDCGYKASIENGIYIDPKAVREKLLDGKPMPSSIEYLESASSEFVNFRYRSMNILAGGLKNHNKEFKCIMELNYCVGFFLNQYIDVLSNDSVYILIDYDLGRLRELKKYLQMNYGDKKFMFLCCNIEDIPFKDSSIDVIIDYWMTKDFAQSDNKFLLDIVLPLLKEDGIMTGVYPYFSFQSKQKGSDILSEEVRDYFDREKILDKLKALNLTEIDFTDIGPSIENNPYNLDIKGKELYQAIYTAQKKSE